MLVSIAECISQAKWMHFAKSSHHLTRLQDFDEASRGPWGSLLLLLKAGGADWIASAAAVLTIICLALDPFAQQIIAYPSRMVVSMSGTASFAATTSLDHFDTVAMHGAIFNGLYLSNVSPVIFNCTTSRCGWDNPVISLGVCSACRNITSVVDVTCETKPGPLAPEEGHFWSFSTTNCTFAVGSNITFEVYIQSLTLPDANGRPAEHASEYTKVKLMSPSIELGLGDFISTDTRWIQTFLSYVTFLDNAQTHMPPMSLDHLRPEIFACGIYWCGQVYDDIAVVEGSLNLSSPSATFGLEIVLGSDGENAEVRCPSRAGQG
ncbi:hypothetical protein K4F52_007911 [Lecanicillium sp. MT-2017a]|nr:hypothetical protein K4F52_007911 [Lecanicillium sp. MT-2017a]